MFNKRLNIKPIENYSGFTIRDRHIPKLKKSHYFRINESVGGDAPKDIIRIYIYGESKRSQPKKWAKYISKYGHKWYPIESITEYLIFRLGEITGLDMAKSRLFLIQGHLRFCSKNFLAKDEVLIHGAEILSRYLHEKSTSFIDEIEKKRLTKSMIGINDVVKAIRFTYPQNAEELLSAYFNMLLFDALIGINDRHFYNWGVIDSIKSDQKDYRFAPIFDSSRGLLWNFSENKLKDKGADKAFISKYIKLSEPKIGLEGKAVNHFQLIEYINGKYAIPDAIKYKFLRPKLGTEFETCIYDEFKYLLSDLRKDLIFRILQDRIKQFTSIFEH